MHVWCLGFWVSDLGFWVLGFGFRVSSFGSRVSGLGVLAYRASVHRHHHVPVVNLIWSFSGFGFRVSGGVCLGFEVPGSGFQVWGLGFGVWSLGFRV